MIDALFVTPTATTEVLKEALGPVLLSTILRQQGMNVELLSFARIGDPKNYEVFFEKGISMILEKKPRIVSFYGRSDCFHIMLLMAQRVKAELDCYIVFAGPQADITAVATLEEIPWVDFVCQGEGETTVYPFFSSLLKREPDLSVAGLVYRTEDGIKVNPRPELIKDLDTLPIPDYNLYSEPVKVDPKTCFSIDVGRGCPFGCTYCSTKTFWGRKYRLKSPERVIQEVKHFHDLYGINYFAFEHDMFTMQKEQVTEICRMIKELDYKIYWNCSARLDCIDKELIDTMADAGMRWIYLGIETGSPRMQKLINKNLKLDQTLPLVRYITSKGVRVVTSFIYGFPEETEEDISQTLALMTDLYAMKDVQLQAHLCAFLPGTALGEEYRDRLVRSKVYSDQTGDIGLVENEQFIFEHPRLFLQCNEYPTELRSKLAYFSLFLIVFNILRPAYLYYAKQYDRDNMIQMYFDFVEDYKDILCNDEPLVTHDMVREIIAYPERFSKRFEKLPFGVRAADVCRMQKARFAVVYGKTSTATEILTINPDEVQKYECLEDVPECWSMATVARDANGRVQMFIRRM